MNIKEEWRPIKGYEGYYEVSNLGRVRRCAVILKERISKYGYANVTLYGRSKPKTCRVHRLVAEAFIENFGERPYVNHIDGCKKNNCVKNLEWSTQKENVQHAYKIGLAHGAGGENNPYAKLTNDQAEEIRNVYIPYDKEYGGRKLAQKYGVSRSVISLIVNNKSYL